SLQNCRWTIVDFRFKSGAIRHAPFSIDNQKSKIGNAYQPPPAPPPPEEPPPKPPKPPPPPPPKPPPPPPRPPPPERREINKNGPRNLIKMGARTMKIMRR